MKLTNLIAKWEMKDLLKGLSELEAQALLNLGRNMNIRITNENQLHPNLTRRDVIITAEYEKEVNLEIQRKTIEENLLKFKKTIVEARINFDSD
jgi:hypothetical protein